MEIRKVGGGFFDLNYFILTSNTKNGGGAANGTEKTYVEAWKNGVMLEQVLLTPDSWGFVGVHNVSSPLQRFCALLNKFRQHHDIKCTAML